MSTVATPAPERGSQPIQFPEPKRAEGFFRYFKQYMGLSSLAVAALPIPVATLKLIRVPEGQIQTYCTYTSLFCFLLSAFIFYSRHSLGKRFFATNYYLEGRSLLLELGPLLLMCGSFFLVVFYEGDQLFNESGVRPLLFFVAMFVFAEAAFALMATREYLQDILGFHDRGIIQRLMAPYSQLSFVTFESTPSGAEVHMDERYGVDRPKGYAENMIGLTPLSITARAGRYEVTIEADGYKLWSRIIQIKEHEPRNVIARLELQAPASKLDLTAASTPPSQK